MMTKNRENPALSRHYENNVVNFGQHYFHNVYIRFAHIHIMKIMLTDIHDIFPHNYPKICLVSFIFHNEKSLPDTTNYANNVYQNENNVDQ